MKKILFIWIIAFSLTNCTTFGCPCLLGEYCARNSESGCLPCEEGTYKTKGLFATSCTSCRLHCGANETMIFKCTRSADIGCQCDAGLYKSEETNDACVTYTPCGPGYGVKIPGTVKSDTVCEKCEGNTFSSVASTTEKCKPCRTCPFEVVETMCTAYRDAHCKEIDPSKYAHKEGNIDPNINSSSSVTTESNTTNNKVTTTTSNTTTAINLNSKSVRLSNVTTTDTCTTKIRRNETIGKTNSEKQSTMSLEQEVHEILDDVNEEKGSLTTIKIITIVNCVVIGLILIAAGGITLVILYRKRKLPCGSRTTDRNRLAEDFFPYADWDGENCMPKGNPDSADEIRPASRGAEENCDTTPAAATTSTDQTNNNEQHTEVYSRTKDASKSSSLPPSLPSRRTEGGSILKKANTVPLQNELQLNVNSLIQTGGAKNSAYTLHRAFTDLSHHLCGVQWEMFFRRLIGQGSDPILHRVKRNHDRDIREQIYQMLLEWERILAKNASLDLIVNELEDFGENLLAEFYRKKLNDIVYV